MTAQMARSLARFMLKEDGAVVGGANHEPLSAMELVFQEFEGICLF